MNVPRYLVPPAARPNSLEQQNPRLIERHWAYFGWTSLNVIEHISFERHWMSLNIVRLNVIACHWAHTCISFERHWMSLRIVRLDVTGHTSFECHWTYFVWIALNTFRLNVIEHISFERHWTYFVWMSLIVSITFNIYWAVKNKERKETFRTICPHALIFFGACVCGERMAFNAVWCCWSSTRLSWCPEALERATIVA